jgi:hypothetical protein
MHIYLIIKQKELWCRCEMSRQSMHSFSYSILTSYLNVRQENGALELGLPPTSDLTDLSDENVLLAETRQS